MRGFPPWVRGGAPVTFLGAAVAVPDATASNTAFGTVVAAFTTAAGAAALLTVGFEPDVTATTAATPMATTTTAMIQNPRPDRLARTRFPPLFVAPLPAPLLG